MRPAALFEDRALLAGLILFVAAATIAGAWGFEVIGGYVPCKLCLEERIPYYVGLPIALVAFVSARQGNASLARIALLGVGLVFAAGFALGAYHAGVEWGWWPGPADCGATGAGPTGSVNDLLDRLKNIKVVSCTEATWRFPAGWGLSFAGWNAAISAVLAGLAYLGVRARQ